MNNISCGGVASLSKLLMLAMFRCKASTELMFIKVSLWMMASIQSFDCGSNDAWPSVAAIDLNSGRSGDGSGIKGASPYGALRGSRAIASIAAISVRKPCNVILWKVLRAAVASCALREPRLLVREAMSDMLIALSLFVARRAQLAGFDLRWVRATLVQSRRIVGFVMSCGVKAARAAQK